MSVGVTSLNRKQQSCFHGVKSCMEGSMMCMYILQQLVEKEKLFLLDNKEILSKYVTLFPPLRAMIDIRTNLYK